MGKVYSPEKVGAREYPQPGAHQKAVETLVDRLQGWDYDSDAPEAGFAYGSVAMRTMGGVCLAKLRSDLDFLVVCEDNTGQSHVDFADVVAEVETATHVTVEANMLNRTEIAGRHHPVTADVLFMEHVLHQSKHSPYVFGEPARVLQECWGNLPTNQDYAQEAVQIIHAYISGKRNRFRGGLSQEGEARYVMLQRAFELPSALARKCVRLQQIRLAACEQVALSLPLQQAEFYGRESLGMQAQLLAPHNALWTEATAELVVYDREYSALLGSVIAEEISIKEYADWLECVYADALKTAIRLTIGAAAIVDTLGNEPI